MIDNNLVENAIRPTRLSAKNYLFFGSAEANSLDIHPTRTEEAVATPFRHKPCGPSPVACRITKSTNSLHWKNPFHML